MFGVTSIKIRCRGILFDFLPVWGAYIVSYDEENALRSVEAIFCFNIGGELVLGDDGNFVQI